MHVLPALHKAHTLPSPRHEPGTWNPCSLNRRRQSDRREQEGSLRAASPGIAGRCHPTGFASFPKNCPRRRGGSSLSARSLTICSFLCSYCRRHFLKLQSVAESEIIVPKSHTNCDPPAKQTPAATTPHLSPPRPGITRQRLITATSSATRPQQPARATTS